MLIDENATQGQVDEAVRSLQAALESLVEAAPAPGTEIRDELQDLYNQYAGLEQGSYTAESYQAFQDALKNAADLLADEDAADKDLQAAYDALAAAVSGLEVSEEPGTTPDDDKPGQADAVRDKLQALYDANKDMQQGRYTNSSYSAFTDALRAAGAVLADDDASVKELTKAYEDLVSAINGLTVKDAVVSDDDKADAVQTGDDSPVMLYAAVTAAAFAVICAAVGVLYIRRRKR